MYRGLLLRPAVTFSALEDGIAFRGWGSHFTIRGHKSLYDVWERVALLLDGSRSRTEVLEALSPGMAKVAGYLLDRLTERDLLIDGSELTTQRPTDWTKYRSAVQFLEAVSTQPYADFVRFRESTVHIGGNPRVAGTVANVLTKSGLHHVVSKEDVAAFEASSGHGVVQVMPSKDRFSVSVFVWIADNLAELKRIWQRRPLVWALVLGRRTLVGTAEDLGDPSLAFVEQISRRSRAPGPVSPVAQRLVAGIVAHQVFKFLALGESDISPGRLGVIDHQSLEVEYIGLPTAVIPRETEAWLSTVMSAENPPDADSSSILERAQWLTDPRWGLITKPRPDRYPQSPISVASCRATTGLRGRVFGCGPAWEQAAAAALREGVRSCHPSEGARGDLLGMAVDGSGPVPVGGHRLVTAVGRTFAELVDDALDQLVVTGHWAASLQWAWDPVPFRSTLSPTAYRLWKALAIRWGRHISVNVARTALLPPLVAVEVRDDTARIGIAGGREMSSVLTAALARAVAWVACDLENCGWFPDSSVASFPEASDVPACMAVVPVRDPHAYSAGFFVAWVAMVDG